MIAQIVLVVLSILLCIYSGALITKIMRTRKYRYSLESMANDDYAKAKREQNMQTTWPAGLALLNRPSYMRTYTNYAEHYTAKELCAKELTFGEIMKLLPDGIM